MENKNSKKIVIDVFCSIIFHDLVVELSCYNIVNLHTH